MQLRTTRNPTIVLGPIILLSFLVSWNFMESLMPGLLYLMAAVLLSTGSICVIVILHKRNREDPRNTDLSSLQARANVLGLVAWQIAIIGGMNISSANLHKSLTHSLADYTLMILFFIASYSILSIVDSPNQRDGYIPFNFFGYPRTRRLIFVVFAGYCTICPLTIASLEFSTGSGGWQPIAFQASQACLLMAAIMSTLSAGLIIQRYRRVMAEQKRTNMSIFVVTLFFIACAAVIQNLFSYRMYVYILSAIAVVTSAVAVSSLWRIGEDTQIANGTIPNGSVSQHPLRP